LALVSSRFSVKYKMQIRIASCVYRVLKTVISNQQEKSIDRLTNLPIIKLQGARDEMQDKNCFQLKPKI
jgi:hypothetical protein